MPSVIDDPSVKAKCQVFTPEYIVDEILNQLGYHENLFGKSVIDHSCGNGQFLKEVVRRYIHDCKEKSLSAEQIRFGLSQDIWGVEIDEKHYADCITSLNKIADDFGVEHVEWKIYNFDALRNPINRQFNYVIGNPPYLSYWDIPEDEREFLRSKYDTCKNGAYDYCFAFIEEGISLLKKDGVLAYIIPSSIFKTITGKAIRNKMKPLVQSIIDYKAKKVFAGALTSSAIICLNRNETKDDFVYCDIMTGSKFLVNRNNLQDIWIFCSGVEKKTEQKHRFGDYFKVSSSVATQLNDAFIVTDWAKDDIWLSGPNGEKLEIAATQKAASPKGKTIGRMEYIIFPYYYQNGQLQIYNEDEYRMAFPHAYSHLEQYKEKLLKRDADKKAQWFEYGRSQALQYLKQPKILLSSVFTNIVHTFKLDETEVPYSGLYIVPISNLSIDEGVKILESVSFQEYIESVGVNVNGSSMRITAKNIRDYRW